MPWGITLSDHQCCFKCILTSLVAKHFSETMLTLMLSFLLCMNGQLTFLKPHKILLSNGGHTAFLIYIITISCRFNPCGQLKAEKGGKLSLKKCG